MNFFWRRKNFTKKSHYESNSYLVKYVAKHYDLLKYIKKDINDPKIPNDYNYEKKYKNKYKYIATAVEAIIGEIYKNDKNMVNIITLLKTWIEFEK